MSEGYKMHRTQTGRMSSENPNFSNQHQATILRSELPDMVPVVSSNIYAIGYDEKNEMMYVLFSKDAPAVYRYPKVSAARYRFVREAPSVGKSFASEIKSYSASDPALAHEKLTLVGDGVAVVEGSP